MIDADPIHFWMAPHVNANFVDFLRATPFFMQLDGMMLGLAYEIGGSCAALSARQVDPLGTVLLLKALSEPYTSLDPDTRIWVASTWLAERGSVLNQTTLSTVDWWQSTRGHQQPLLAGEVQC